jgi:hypothetical protein
MQILQIWKTTDKILYPHFLNPDRIKYSERNSSFQFYAMYVSLEDDNG